MRSFGEERGAQPDAIVAGSYVETAVTMTAEKTGLFHRIPITSLLDDDGSHC